MLKEIRKRRGRVNFLQVWIHRIYRIVPLYLLIVLFGWKIMPQFVVGVAGYTYQELVDYDCHDTWWSNILFLNNFLPVGKTAYCFGHSWYLAVDIQCFLPLPILLVLYYKNRQAGWIATLTLFFGSIMFWFTNSLIHGWATDLPWIMDNMTEYFEFYTKPYYRFGPYGLGIMVGFVISEYKDETLSHNIFAKKLYRFWRKRIFRYLTFAAGTAIILWSIFIHYPVNNGEAAHWSQFKKSAFLASQRSIWVFGWALLFMPTMMGWGSLLRGVLGASFWSPFTRLTFGAYLIHPILQVWYYWQLEQAWFIGNLNSVINGVGFAAAAYILSTIFTLMAETPAMNIEKFWMPHRKEKEGPKEQTA
jgi:peptidoglycan/LPS O-acetylase OafA/YrhL